MTIQLQSTPSSSAEYRLLGPPGGGKSENLGTKWLPRAAEVHGAERVLVCSLTRAAAHEIRARAGGVIPDPNVGTLHALAYRALKEGSDLKVAEVHVSEWNEAHPEYALRVADESSIDEPFDPCEPSDEAPGEGLYSSTQILRHRCVPRREWPADELVFQETWERWQHERGFCDFTAMIEDCLAAEIRTPADARMLVVDEAQDCSRLEMRLIRQWAAGRHLVLAGDPNQSIYTFRGADPEAFLNPPVPDDHCVVLTQSYRLPRAVHASAAAWFSQSIEDRLLSYRPRDANGAVRYSSAGYGDADALIEELHEELSRVKGRVLLLATCGYMLRAPIAVLKKNGVPFFNPWRRNRREWNPLDGASTRLRAFLTPDHGGLDGLHAGWTWWSLHRWTPLLAHGLLADGASRRITTKAASRNESRWAPGIEDLTALFADGGRFVQVALSVLRRSPADGAVWLERHLNESATRALRYGLDVLYEHGLSGLGNEPRVIVGTVHATKGGQGDSVVLLPDLSQAGQDQWYQDPDATVRQFYVGMTRARERLVLCSPSSRRHVQW